MACSPPTNQSSVRWIKVLCVYLPISLGYNVLFQDADVVWLKDPVHDYFLHPQIAGDFDVWFQDDGSRSTRFSPYFSSENILVSVLYACEHSVIVCLLFLSNCLPDWFL